MIVVGRLVLGEKMGRANVVFIGIWRGGPLDGIPRLLIHVRERHHSGIVSMLMPNLVEAVVVVE